MDSHIVLQGASLNLQQICAASVSSRLWDNIQVKQKIKNFFSAFHCMDYHIKIWNNEIVNLVLQHFSTSVMLPKPLSAMIEEFIYMMGGKIWKWTFHVKNVLKFDFKFAEKIIWTCVGTIDEKKIFTNIWRKKFDDFKEKGIFKVHPLFSVGCALVEEDFLTEFQEEIISSLTNEFPLEGVEIKENDIPDLVALTLALDANAKNESKNESEDSFSDAIDSMSSATEMFELCLHSGYVEAAKIFWVKLHDREKNRLLMRTIEICLHKCIGEEDIITHRKEKQSEIVFFLITETLKSQNVFNISIIRDNFIQFFEILLYAWPYQESSVNIFYKFSDTLPSMVQGQAFLLIAQSIKKIRDKESHELESIFEKIFIDMFFQLPDFMKQDIFTEQKFVLHEYFRILDKFFLSTILEDKDLRFFNAVIIREGLEFFETKKISFLNEFLDLISSTFEQIDADLQDCFVRLCENFAINGQFDACDLILDFLSKNDEERLIFKNQIDTKRVCKNLIIDKWRYDLAEKFLNWRFYALEDKLDFKKSLPSDWYIYDRCIKIWTQRYSNTDAGELNLRRNFYCMEKFIDSITEACPFKNYMLPVLMNAKNFNELKSLRNSIAFVHKTEVKSQKIFIDNLVWWKSIYGEEFKNFENFDFLFEWTYIDSQSKEYLASEFVRQNCGYVFIRLLILLIIGSRNI